MVNFGPLAAEMGLPVWGRHPSTFQRVSRLGSVTARHSSSGCHPKFVALNRGCHLYLAGRPPRWALAHTLVIVTLGLSKSLEGEPLGLLGTFFCSLDSLSVTQHVVSSTEINLGIDINPRKPCTATSTPFVLQFQYL